MKNKLIIIFVVFLFNFTIFKAYGSEIFNFDVTEIQISENGNKIIGTKRGTITSSDGILIEADQFEYNKKLNILNANGNVKITDKINKPNPACDKVLPKIDLTKKLFLENLIPEKKVVIIKEKLKNKMIT